MNQKNIRWAAILEAIRCSTRDDKTAKAVDALASLILADEDPWPDLADVFVAPEKRDAPYKEEIS